MTVDYIVGLYDSIRRELDNELYSLRFECKYQRILELTKEDIDKRIAVIKDMRQKLEKLGNTEVEWCDSRR